MIALILRAWCRMAHTRTFRPCRGKYRCAQCLREWPVPWAVEEREPAQWRATADVAEVGE